MTQKKRGFRSIIVYEQPFNWRFSKVIDIRPAKNKNNQLLVDFSWFDEFLYVNDPENRPKNFEPKFITPKFIEAAIQFAIKQGWQIDKKSGRFKLLFSEGRFKMDQGNIP